jgi:hypothetical protein
MSINMTYNHLQEAETIIKLLRLEGKKEHADKVDEVMAGASTRIRMQWWAF